MILPHGRLVYENVISFLPNKDISFVVYDKYADSFFCDARKWSGKFNEKDCVFEHYVTKLAVDTLVLTELINHLYVINKLDILSVFEYTVLSDEINFSHAWLDGKRDYITILDMIKDNNA